MIIMRTNGVIPMEIYVVLLLSDMLFVVVAQSQSLLLYYHHTIQYCVDIGHGDGHKHNKLYGGWVGKMAKVGKSQVGHGKSVSTIVGVIFFNCCC